jgi:DNA-binding GntR family transcriptional regulator
MTCGTARGVPPVRRPIAVSPLELARSPSRGPRRRVRPGRGTDPKPLRRPGRDAGDDRLLQDAGFPNEIARHGASDDESGMANAATGCPDGARARARGLRGDAPVTGQRPVLPPERKRGSGARMVYDLLRNEILDLVLPPGSPVDEVQLAERYRISRTPVREALVRLAGEGLIETLPNRSTMVAGIDFLNLQPLFDAMVLMYRVTTRLAAQHHRPDDLRAVRAHQAEFAAAVAAQDALSMIATNAAFHAAIAEAGRNPYFAGLFGRLLDENRRLMRLYYRSYDDRLPQAFVAEHEGIIDAVAARDVEAADRLAKAHALQIVGQIQQLFTREPRLDVEL